MQRAELVCKENNAPLQQGVREQAHDFGGRELAEEKVLLRGRERCFCKISTLRELGTTARQGHSHAGQHDTKGMHKTSTAP